MVLLLPIEVVNWCKDTTFKTNKPINYMVVSPSGRYLAVAHNDNVVRFYQGLNYILLGSYNVGYSINTMRFSNNGLYLAIGGSSSLVTILNAYEPFTLNRTMGAFNGITATSVVGVDFSSDSTKFIACGSATGGGKMSMYTVDPLLAWSPSANSPVSMVPASNAAIDCRFSPFDGKIAIIISNKITIYDPTLTTASSTLTSSTNFNRVVFDPLSSQLVFIDWAGAKFTNWVIGGATTQLTVTGANFFDSDFMPNGNYVAAGGQDKILFIYNKTRVIY